MDSNAFPHLLAIGLVFVGAGLVKGVIGMGLPTIAMGLLGLLMPLPQAAALLTLPSLVTNAWQAAGPGWRDVLRRLWALQIGIAAGVALAAAVLPRGHDALGRTLLGACLLAYGAAGLAGWRPVTPPARWQGRVGAWVGLATGGLTALSGVYVLPAVPYLQSLTLERRALSQALGLCFTTATVALGVMLAWQGELAPQRGWQSAAMLPPALLGLFIGQRLREAMSERVFRRCFFAGLAALGAWSLWTGR